MHGTVELDAYVLAFYAFGYLSAAELGRHCHRTDQKKTSLDHRGPILADN
jgi:hypothetical protein